MNISLKKENDLDKLKKLRTIYETQTQFVDLRLSFADVVRKAISDAIELHSAK